MTVTVHVSNEWTVNEAGDLITRPLYPNESFFSIGGQSWPVKFGLAIKAGDGIADKLRDAWAKVIIDYPLAAATAGLESLTVPLFSSKEALDQWVAKSFTVDTEAETSQDIAFHGADYSRVFFVPKSSEVVLVGPHANLDAGGAVKFFNILLTYASSSAAVDEFRSKVQNIPPGFNPALGITAPTEQQQKWATDKFTSHLQTLPGISDRLSEGKDINSPPQQSKHWVHTLSREDTTRIITVAKRLGVSVTSLLYAGLSSTEIKFNSPHDGEILDQYSTFSITSARDVSTSPLVPDAPFGFFGVMWPLAVDLTPDTARTAGKFQEYFSWNAEAFKRNNHDEVESPLNGAPVVISGLAGLVKQSLTAPPMRLGASFSSFGVIDKDLKTRYGEISVLGLRVSTASYSPQIPLFLYSFDGKLNIGASYNSAYFTDEYTRKLTTSIVEEALRA